MKALLWTCLFPLLPGDITASFTLAQLQGEAEMKARLVGFEAITNTPVTIGQLWTHLRGQSNETKYSQAKRLTYLEEHDGHAYGLLLTTKSHKKACELINSDGKLKIAVTSVADNSERIDFNFIVVRLATQKGLYLQYRGSWNIHSFATFLHGRYGDAARIAREKAIADSKLPKNGKKSKAIREQYKKPTLDVKLIVREQKLAELLNRLNSISSFDFPLTTLTMRSKWFSPLRDAVTAEDHTIKFRSDVSKRSLIDGIIKTIGAAKITAGKVYGKNEAGITEYVDLIENPDVFEAFEFDDIADEQNLNLADIRSSSLVQRMRALLDEHAHIFDAPQKKRKS